MLFCEFEYACPTTCAETVTEVSGASSSTIGASGEGAERRWTYPFARAWNVIGVGVEVGVNSVVDVRANTLDVADIALSVKLALTANCVAVSTTYCVPNAELVAFR
jgi:hypothetical protein